MKFAGLIVLLGFAFYATNFVTGESLTCLTVYREGGAPAVFQSPKCPRWTMSAFKRGSDRRSGSTSAVCQSAMLKGRRKSQEDRTLCALNLRIPFPGPRGVTEMEVGIMAVFDGHNGAEASDMASELLLEYFVLHTYFLLDTTYLILSNKFLRRLNGPGFQKIEWNEGFEQQILDLGRFKATLSAVVDGSFPFELLRESLLRAIHDVDADFSKDASRYNLTAGTTATVALLADSQILVANLGDSKAFLCSEVYQSPSEAKATVLRVYRQRRSHGGVSSLEDYHRLKSMASHGWTFLIAKELTNDHHPDRDDEKSRVESAGGYITTWSGVARVNGQLAVSRAIGDIYLKGSGVISIPEVTDWQPLTPNDSYVIAASDGVFQDLAPQDICDMLWEPLSHLILPPELNASCSYSLADCIVNTAFERGSTDNLAAILIPLRALGSSPSNTFAKNRSYKLTTFDDYSAVGDEKQNYEDRDDGKPSIVAELQLHQNVDKFDRLLVEGKHNSGCFYLSENLDVNDDYTFWVHKDDQGYVSDQSPALIVSDPFFWSRPLDLYNDQHVCAHFGRYIHEDKDQCMKSDGFARFLGLLESIPFNVGQNDHVPLETRYILKKKFDRGAYGEVWLAFDWHCSQGMKDLKRRNIERTFHGNEHPRMYDENMSTNAFILKRIMVERGISAYLSGLREKYFGEVFSNASYSLRGSLHPQEPDFVWETSQCNPHAFSFTHTNESTHETKGPSSSNNMGIGEKGLHDAAYEDGLNHIARYVESFESRSNEIWLVFRHEGTSLTKLLYTAEEVITDDKEGSERGNRVQILRPSKWWHWLKSTESGKEEFRNIILQLLMALKSCHDRNITHRDIKPGEEMVYAMHFDFHILHKQEFAEDIICCFLLENMVMCFEDQNSGNCLRGNPETEKNYTTKMRIIDFGSAVNDFTVKRLYGSVGPSSAEQTSEYAPPEAFLNLSWYRGPPSVTAKYDMWSVGVVMLEFILGSPNVFQISSLTQVLLDQHLKGWNDSLKGLAYKLRALMEMCILIPGISSKLHQNWGTNGQASGSPVPWKCSEEYLSNLIRSRDPLKLGFPNVWALRLVRDLLRWNPEDRLSVDEALQHPYFSLVSQKSSHAGI